MLFKLGKLAPAAIGIGISRSIAFEISKHNFLFVCARTHAAVCAISMQLACEVSIEHLAMLAGKCRFLDLP
jgi:hypothetical protein